MSEVVKKDTVEWPMGFGGAIVNKTHINNTLIKVKKMGKNITVCYSN